MINTQRAPGSHSSAGDKLEDRLSSWCGRLHSTKHRNAHLASCAAQRRAERAGRHVIRPSPASAFLPPPRWNSDFGQTIPLTGGHTPGVRKRAREQALVATSTRIFTRSTTSWAAAPGTQQDGAHTRQAGTRSYSYAPLCSAACSAAAAAGCSPPGPSHSSPPCPGHTYTTMPPPAAAIPIRVQPSRDPPARLSHHGIHPRISAAAGARPLPPAAARTQRTLRL